MTPTLPNVAAAADFAAAAQLVLDYLREAVPMPFWAVTRVENGRQTYLYLDADNGYGLTKGQSHAWESSFCIRMAAGEAPTVAPDAQSVPAYATAGINQQVPIGAYAGAAVYENDGSLYGAICGLAPESRADDPHLIAAAPIMQLLGQLLTMALHSDRLKAQAHAAIQAERLHAETDVLTGLLNRRAWERLMAEEEKVFNRFGDPTVLGMIDLDMLKHVNDTLGHAAGDEYIRRAAQAMLAAVRPEDRVARLGGDEFGILLRNCSKTDADNFVARLYARLEAEGVAGSVGWAPISVLRGLPAALEEADAAMYAAKASRRSTRRVLTS